MDSEPAPHFLNALAWRLAKQSRDLESAAAYRATMPLDRLAGAPDEVAPDHFLGLFTAPDEPLAFALETDDPRWLQAVVLQIDQGEAPRADQPWSAATARRVLTQWRLAELSRDSSHEIRARTDTHSFYMALRRSEQPAVVSAERKGGPRVIEESGHPGPHAWAALALFKAYELGGETRFRDAGVEQARHLLDRHVSKGTVVFTTLAKGETMGPAIPDLKEEGAYVDACMVVHALLRAHEHSRDKAFHDAALAIRARLLAGWRKDHGGFGKMDYWDGGGAREVSADLQPKPSKRQVSLYQQPWAMMAFWNGCYPYWGTGIKEERPGRGILDFILNR